jgi:hypothetical protein
MTGSDSDVCRLSERHVFVSQLDHLCGVWTEFPLARAELVLSLQYGLQLCSYTKTTSCKSPDSAEFLTRPPPLPHHLVEENNLIVWCVWTVQEGEMKTFSWFSISVWASRWEMSRDQVGKRICGRINCRTVKINKLDFGRSLMILLQQIKKWRETGKKMLR